MKAIPSSAQIVQQQLALDIYLKTLLDEIPDADADIAPVIAIPSIDKAPARKIEPIEPAHIADHQPMKEMAPSEQVTSSLVSVPKHQALSVMPDWAQHEFQALFFKVEHMILATPLHDLSRTINLDRKIGKIPGQPSWFMGLLDDQDSRIGVLDTGQLVFGKQRGSQRDLEKHPFKQILITEDKRWGLVCDEILSIGRLQPDKVRWRTQRPNRPWLIGTVIEELTAIIDVQMLVPHRKTTNQSI